MARKNTITGKTRELAEELSKGAESAKGSNSCLSSNCQQASRARGSFRVRRLLNIAQAAQLRPPSTARHYATGYWPPVICLARAPRVRPDVSRAAFARFAATGVFAPGTNRGVTRITAAGISD